MELEAPSLGTKTPRDEPHQRSNNKWHPKYLYSRIVSGFSPPSTLDKSRNQGTGKGKRKKGEDGDWEEERGPKGRPRPWRAGKQTKQTEQTEISQPEPEIYLFAVGSRAGYPVLFVFV